MSNELSAQDLLPPEIGLTLLGFEKSEQGWLVRAEGRTRSECPACGTQSTARHSRYWRRLQDLPVQGKRVVLQLRLSRWRCRNGECEQAIFRERLGVVVAPWARRTSRVEEILLLVGHRTGGRAAEFLMKRLAMSVSDDTILRRIKRMAKAAVHVEQRLRVVGVDDWAWKKGQTYGTILVDLERRTVADLLPQRSAEQLAEWLRQHPEVEVITRDRFGLYAGGAQRGAPQARQVADRFHLLMNLRETVEKELGRQRRRLVLPLADDVAFRIIWRSVSGLFGVVSLHARVVRHLRSGSAGHSIAHSPWARSYYQQQRERGKGHHAAVRGLAFKWIRIVFRCWKDRVTYDESRYLDALAKRNSPLAAVAGGTIL